MNKERLTCSWFLVPERRTTNEELRTKNYERRTTNEELQTKNDEQRTFNESLTESVGLQEVGDEAADFGVCLSSEIVELLELFLVEVVLV